MSGPSACGAGEEALLDYLAGELDTAAAEALEEHLFACAACADRLAGLERLRAAIAEVARSAALTTCASEALVQRLARDGLTRREYLIAAGGSVACKAGPEDLVVVRLAAPFGGLETLELSAEVADLARDVTAALPPREVVADRERDEIVLVFPGEVVRAYPRSRWTMRVRGEGPAGPAEIGAFVMDHTP